jgi:outer membrane protein assembly factor BamB
MKMRAPDAHHRRVRIIMLLAMLLMISGCALPSLSGQPSGTHRHIPPAATVSPLASQTVYWSQDLSLWALRASDGHLRWRIGNWNGPLLGCNGCTYYAGPEEPTLADGTLYTLTVNEHASSAVYAFSAKDGTTRWQTPVAGCASSRAPLVVAGVIYVALSENGGGEVQCGASGWVYALRAKDGHVLWRVPFERVVWSTLALTNGVLVVANSTYPASPEVVSLTGLRSSDGHVLWRVSHSESAGTDLGDFAAADGMVIINIKVHSGMDVEALRAGDGARVWETVYATRLFSSMPFLVNGVVYLSSDLGYLYALRASDGKTLWRFRAGSPFVGQPVFANGHLYVGIGPTLDVLDVTSGTLLRAYPLFNPDKVSSDDRFAWSIPVVTETTIFVSAGVGFCFDNPLCGDPWVGYLYALDVATGKVIWRYQAPKENEGFWASTPVLGP